MKTKPKTDSTSTAPLKSLSRKGAAKSLTQLGDKPTASPEKRLETFPNPSLKRDFVIHMQIPEFTCLCPITGQPDFEKERNKLIDYIERMISVGPNGITKEQHPFFGKLTSDEWDLLIAKHLDHHLRQFGG